MAPKNPSKSVRASEPMAGKVEQRRPGPGGQQSASDEVQETERALSVGIGLASVALAVYVKTAYPTVPGGDAGELCFASCSLAIAHPPGQEPNKNRTFVHRRFCCCLRNHLRTIRRLPCISSLCPAPSSSLYPQPLRLDPSIAGYPLFIMAGHLFTRLIHFGTPGFRVNCVSCACGAAAVLFFYLFCQRYPHPPPSPRDHPIADRRGGNAKKLCVGLLRLQSADCVW